MTPDTFLQLGDFTFSSFEVPEEIRFGGAQRLSTKELIGGQRVIDAMGRSDRPLEWHGVFTGVDASDRAQFLDSLRVSGLPQDLSWGQFKYQVIVREFEASYQRFYRIPYRITCEVVTDQTNPVNNAPEPAIDDAIEGDQATVDALAASIADDPLSELMDVLDTAIDAIDSFTNAAQSAISSVLQPLAAVQARVGVLIGSVSSALGLTSTFGGVLPNTPIAIAAAQLTGQVADMEQCNNLFMMRNVLGRMDANLACANSPSASVSTAGGNLFQIAEDQYGDATAWTALARANGLTDPFVSGAATLAIPSDPGNSGGILSA